MELDDATYEQVKHTWRLLRIDTFLTIAVGIVSTWILTSRFSTNWFVALVAGATGLSIGTVLYGFRKLKRLLGIQRFKRRWVEIPDKRDDEV